MSKMSTMNATKRKRVCVRVSGRLKGVGVATTCRRTGKQDWRQ